jgi:hypothetical protein
MCDWKGKWGDFDQKGKWDDFDRKGLDKHQGVGKKVVRLVPYDKRFVI